MFIFKIITEERVVAQTTMATEYPADVIAADAVNSALGAALSCYVKKFKEVQKDYSEEVSGALNEFDFMVILEEITPKRELLNKKYLKGTPGEYIKKFNAPAKKTKSPKKPDLTADKLINACNLTRYAANQALQTFLDELAYWKNNESVDYSLLKKTIQKSCITDITTYFKKLVKDIDTILMPMLMK
jgi:predicted ATPase with chaperone activity